MQVAIITFFLMILPACTAMLVGNASSGGGVATDRVATDRVATDNRSATQVAVDNRISAAIRQQLSADPMLSRYAIGIMTSGNTVILSGAVGSFEARDRAVRIAGDTDGVESVRNQIAVNTNL